jgi:hypothetical protein
LKQPKLTRRERRKKLAEFKKSGQFNKVELAFLKRALKNAK